MLKIECWDNLNCDWASWELDLPADCRDAHKINGELNDVVGGDDEVLTTKQLGDCLVIVCGNEQLTSIITVEGKPAAAKPADSATMQGLAANLHAMSSLTLVQMLCDIASGLGISDGKIDEPVSGADFINHVTSVFAAHDLV